MEPQTTDQQPLADQPPPAKESWLEADVRMPPEAAAAAKRPALTTAVARERWLDIDTVLRPAPEQVRVEHLQAVRDIAEARFKFPTEEFHLFRTHLNVPEVTVPVKLDGVEVAPDIVVIDGQTHRLVMHAQVEVPETMTEQQAREKWALYSRLAGSAFYLYVPVGYANVARALLRRVRARPDGLRTWRYLPQGIEINNISDRKDLLGALLPAPLKRALLQ